MFDLIKKYPNLIIFSMLTALFTGPGQTYLTSAFVPYMQSDLGISSGAMGTLYAVATLASAAILPFWGRLLDRHSTLTFTVLTSLALALGCATLAFTHTLILITLGFLLIRLMGQGAMTLLSTTTMTRSFGHHRGKALSLASLGFPIGNALFPLFVTAVILAYGWRGGWMALTLSILVIYLPIAYMTVRQSKMVQFYDKYEHHSRAAAATSLKPIKHFRLSEVLKDRRFYWMLMPGIMPAFLMTALFFHHAFLVGHRGWGPALIAAAFVAYALTRATASFTIGPLIDRYSATKLFSVHLIPLAICLYFLAWGPGAVSAYVYLALAGITIGVSDTIKSAMMAEMYGTRHHGSIRSFQRSAVVIATAISPALLGWLIDINISLSAIYAGLLLALVLTVGMSFVVSFHRFQN